MRWVMWIGVLLGLALGQSQQERFESRFDQAWRLIKEQYWDRNYNGVNWEDMRGKYLPQALRAGSWDDFYEVLGQMYDELADDHSTILSPRLAQSYLAGGQCLAVPYKETWQEAAAPRPAPPANSNNRTQPAAPTPAAPSAPPTETVSAFGPATLEVRDNVVIVRLTNLVDQEGLEQLREAIRLAEGASAKNPILGIVIDLRGNPGGLALRMAEVAGLFMRGFPWRIVTRSYGTIPQPTVPTFGRPSTNKPLVLLIDRNVNSAAEGLAGALQNAKRAYVIGERTAGNTEVLLPYCFTDGAVALVASGVLAPLSGPTWEGRGVLPDLAVDPSQALGVALRYLNTLGLGVR